MSRFITLLAAIHLVAFLIGFVVLGAPHLLIGVAVMAAVLLGVWVLGKRGAAARQPAAVLSADDRAGSAPADTDDRGRGTGPSP